MRDRWRTFCRGRGEDLFDELSRRYGEPHRAYHTLAHIADCLREFDGARRLAERPDEVELALWYHDAVYDTRAHDNEERSAERARDAAATLGWSREAGSRVADLILATRHVASPVGADAQVLVDVDLSILGRPEGEFDAYERAIRAEYAWVPEEALRSGRASILERMLARPTLYATPYFREKYEVSARANLRRSLSGTT